LKLQLPSDPVRLWEVSVGGRPVTARQAGDETLIPLPATVDPNAPVEVKVRLGKPAIDRRHVSLVLPTVFAPVLKTQWNVNADQNHVLVSSGGNVEPMMPSRWPNGFDWLANRGLLPLIALAVLAVIAGIVGSTPFKLYAFAIAMVIAGAACWDALMNTAPAAPLQLSLPVLASGESVKLEVTNIPAWRAFISWPGFAMVMFGTIVTFLAWRVRESNLAWLVRWIAFGMIAIGLLLQTNGASWFYGLVMLAIAVPPPFISLPVARITAVCVATSFEVNSPSPLKF
jgi:hypothetical protein